MLSELHLVDTGPARRFDLELAERLNVLTGDNGLGKSFVLDVVWWTLTGHWTGYPAGPYRAPGRQFVPAELRPEIRWSRGSGAEVSARYNHTFQDWGRWSHSYACIDQPVLYAHVDGSFSVADPLRTRPPRGDSDMIPSVWNFDEKVLWGGSQEGARSQGLIVDWVHWQLMADAGHASPFSHLQQVLRSLSPHPNEELRLGEPVRVYRNRSQDIPTLQFPHAVVPVIHASAGMKRVLALAYMMIWTWYEHTRAAEVVGEQPSRRIAVLVDEVESHLHPQWQRRILPAIVDALRSLWQDVECQLFVTTHSPLVLASLEPHFDPAMDALFRFELEDDTAVLRREVWAKQGDAVNWLVSPNFGLEQARSIEAERAIEAAQAFMRGDVAELPDDLRTAEAIDAALVRLLPALDHFWPRWIVSRHRSGAV